VPILALALLILLPLLVIASMPLILVLRYRAGTARRLARPWIATVNAVMMIVSAGFFLAAAAVTQVWVPDALRSAAAGLGVGGVLGLAGLWLTRWEPTARDLHYTPNRWLVLGVTLVVAARVMYGLWRGAAAWSATDGTSFVAAFGVGGSLAAGGTVIGYYVVYFVGLRRRIGRWQARALRVMS
jgi:hypothetical protein